MKKTVVACMVLLLSSHLGYSQENNGEMLKKAETQLKIAVEKENYTEAARLQSEIETRKKIELAITNEDYSEAAKLKESLGNTERTKDATQVNKSSTINQYKKLTPPKPGMGVVEIVRVTHYDYGAIHPIFCDGKLMNYVKGVSHARLELTPGEHLIWTPAESDHYVKIKVEEGQTYFIVHDFKMGVWRSDVDMTPVVPTDTDLISRCLSVMDKYVSKVLAGEPQAYLEKQIKKKKINIEKSKEKFEQGIKDDPKLTKTVDSDQFIPIEYL